MPTNPLEITLQDIRAIVHGLKMAGLAFVDQEALGDIESRIKLLPSPEEINKIAESPKAIHELQKFIGEIMQLIDVYSRRDPEFKARHKSRTGLPPRYKVLEWRNVMNQASRNLVKSLVKISSVADEKGRYKIAKETIRCARKVQKAEIEEKDIKNLVSQMDKEGMTEELKLLKEAQAWQTFKGFMGGIGGGIGGGVGNVFKNIWQSGQAGGLSAKFVDVGKRIERLTSKLANIINKASSSGNANVQRQMQSLYDIVAASAKGWNQAVDQANQMAQQAEQESPAEVAQSVAAAPGDKTQAVQYLQGLMGTQGLDSYQQRALQNAIDSLNR